MESPGGSAAAAAASPSAQRDAGNTPVAAPLARQPEGTPSPATKPEGNQSRQSVSTTIHVALKTKRLAKQARERAAKVAPDAAKPAPRPRPPMQACMTQLWSGGKAQDSRQFLALYSMHVANVQSSGAGFELAYSQLPELQASLEDAGLFTQASKSSIAVSVRLTTVARVDVKTGMFFVEGEITVRWFDESAAHLDYNTQVPESELGSLVQAPEIGNAVGTFRMEAQSAFVTVRAFPDDARGLCAFTWLFAATCSVPFDLHAFPFDAQELAVEVLFNATGAPASPSFGRRMVPESQYDARRASRAGVAYKHGVAFNGLVEYDMFEPFITAFGGALAPHKFVVSVPVLRQSRSFVVHVLAPIFFINSLTFTVAGMLPQKGDSGRMEVTCGCLVAIVSFKFSIQDSLPKTAYLTALDVYLSAALAVNLAVSLALAYFSAVELKTRHQSIIQGGIAVVWLAFNARFAVTNANRVANLKRSKGYEVPRKPLVLKRRRRVMQVKLS